MRRASPALSGDSGAVTPLMVAVFVVLFWVMALWFSGPVAFSVTRQRAAAAADATALAAVGWGDVVAGEVARVNGAAITALRRAGDRSGSTVTVWVSIGDVTAAARATNILVSAD